MNVINQEFGQNWALYHGDSVIVAKGIPDNSIGLSCYSPPFPGLYVYTNSPYDMGNAIDIDQMISQYEYLQKEILRITMPGRSSFMHITQGIAQKQRDGYVGLKDFRGKIIEMMDRVGWDYYGEITVDKDAQLKAMRTKDHGLMFKSLANDAAKMHVAMPDIVLQFRKPGENPEPIRAGINEKYGSNGWVTNDEWIEWARPVWLDIQETNVLNVRQARETNDERHLCPLQLDLIERVIKIWSNPGDIVFSPFAGIGSEGYQALKFDRKFIGIELKDSYFKSAIENLRYAETEAGTMTLFDLMAEMAAD